MFAPVVSSEVWTDLLLPPFRVVARLFDGEPKLRVAEAVLGNGWIRPPVGRFIVGVVMCALYLPGPGVEVLSVVFEFKWSSRRW